ncbi:MAG: hypothetical protein AAF645_16400 [Myxococcota bacterium]
MKHLLAILVLMLCGLVGCGDDDGIVSMDGSVPDGMSPSSCSEPRPTETCFSFSGGSCTEVPPRCREGRWFCQTSADFAAMMIACETR